jgi:hypothetical protein
LRRTDLELAEIENGEIRTCRAPQKKRRRHQACEALNSGTAQCKLVIGAPGQAGSARISAPMVTIQFGSRCVQAAL